MKGTIYTYSGWLFTALASGKAMTTDQILERGRKYPDKTYGKDMDRRQRNRLRTKTRAAMARMVENGLVERVPGNVEKWKARKKRQSTMRATLGQEGP